MSSVEEVEAAAQQFNGYELEGRPLRVNSGPPPPKNLSFRRMTLLLGPPGCGKATLLLAVTGTLEKNLKATSEVADVEPIYNEDPSMSSLWSEQLIKMLMKPQSANYSGSIAPAVQFNIVVIYIEK